MKNNKGISLIALIITIIVIIILAAIVIGGIFNTPTQGKFARFCNDIGNVQEAVNIAHYSRMSAVGTQASSDAIDNSKIYKWIATGDETAETEEIQVGYMARTMVKIDKDNNKLNTQIPEYGGQDWYIDLSNGEVYMLPGFSYDDLQYTSQAEISIPKYSIVRYAKVGDYVVYNADSNEYTPLESETGNNENETQYTQNSENTGEDSVWRVWENDGKTVKLVHVEPLNSLRLGYQGTNTTSANEPDSPNKAIRGYLNAEKVINEMCSTLYSKKGYSTEVRSLMVEDIQSKLTTRFTPSATKYAYFLSSDTEGYNNFENGEYLKAKHTGTMYNGVPAPRFYTWDKGGVVRTDTVTGVKYAEPEIGNPVYITPTYVGGSIAEDRWKAISDTNAEGTTSYGDLFNGTYGWLASSCVASSSSASSFYVSSVRSDNLYAYYVALSRGIARSGAFGVRPLVSLSSGVQVGNATLDNAGSSVETAWILK